MMAIALRRLTQPQDSSKRAVFGQAVGQPLHHICPHKAGAFATAHKLEIMMIALDYAAARPASQTVHAKPRPVVSRADEGGWFAAIPGETVRVRVPSAAVGGGFAIVESVVEPGFGPPLHFHREDEIFQIIEGIMTFQVGEQRVNAGPGTIVAVPAGMHHGWFNFSKAPVRMLVTFAPGGVETLFAQLPGLSVEEMGRLAASYGTVVVGGPLTE